MPVYDDHGNLYPEEKLSPPWWIAVVVLMGGGMVGAFFLCVLVYGFFT